MQPAVTITELDGALGVLPPSAGRLYALVGVASSGPINTPGTFARVKDVIATYTSGPLVEAAAAYIGTAGKPVVLTRTAQSTAGVVSAVDPHITGTSVATVSGTPTPDDDAQIVVRIVRPGTVGTAGVTYKVSLDGGRNYSAETALGTATSITIPEAGGVVLALAAGTLVAGDTFGVTTTAPNWSDADLQAALTALASSAVQWEQVHAVGPIGAGAFDALETTIAALVAAGKYRYWMGNTRIPTLGETEAAYLAALSLVFASKATKHGGLCMGACKHSSGVSGRRYRRPIAYGVAARQADVSEEVDIADINLGPLVGVSIRDDNGNVDEHDESINPGGDDARFITLRTWDGYGGVYVNRPLLFAPTGSDFQLVPHRRVINLAHAALRGYFIRRLNRPVLVDRLTGFILETEALEIEAGARAALRSTLLAKPKASAVEVALSRHDNLLSTKTLNAEARITPLAYPETINLSVGFYNPALQVQAA